MMLAGIRDVEAHDDDIEKWRVRERHAPRREIVGHVKLELPHTGRETLALEEGAFAATVPIGRGLDDRPSHAARDRREFDRHSVGRLTGHQIEYMCRQGTHWHPVLVLQDVENRSK